LKALRKGRENAKIKKKGHPIRGNLITDILGVEVEKPLRTNLPVLQRRVFGKAISDIICFNMKFSGRERWGTRCSNGGMGESPGVEGAQEEQVSCSGGKNSRKKTNAGLRVKPGPGGWEAGVK